jgi:large subunit ribosomal protein L24
MARPAPNKSDRNTVKLNIRQGDEVMVIAGKDRSTRKLPRRGRVIKVDADHRRLTVEGINMIKKAVRESGKVRQAGVIDMPAPIHVSNVMLVCPACEAPTRVAHRVKTDGKHVRVCRRCKQDIEKG